LIKINTLFNYLNPEGFCKILKDKLKRDYFRKAKKKIFIFSRCFFYRRTDSIVPLKVNIKCILPVAFLVFSLLQSIFFNRRIRKPFPPRSFFMIHTLFVSSFQKHSSHLCFILQKLSRRSRWICFFFFLSKQVDFFLKCAARAQELI
jgi:hypothetical protein